MYFLYSEFFSRESSYSRSVFNVRLMLLEVSLDSQLKNLLQVTSTPAIPISVMGVLSNWALTYISQNFRKYFGSAKCFFQSLIHF